MHTDHWNKRALDFVRPHFDQAQRLARIATGFFTVQGFDLVRRVLAGKQVQILVGFDEKSKERLRQKLIEDILLHLSQWSAEDLCFYGLTGQANGVVGFALVRPGSFYALDQLKRI